MLFYHSNCKVPGIAAFAEVGQLLCPWKLSFEADVCRCPKKPILIVSVHPPPQIEWYELRCIHVQTPHGIRMSRISSRVMMDVDTVRTHSSHPYFDQKTDKDKPKWYMVDVTFVSRAPHFIPLALLRIIAAASDNDVPEDVRYIGAEGAKAIKRMSMQAL